MRYLITFTCYGAHLHGDETGSVDRDHNLYGSRLLPAQPWRLEAELQAMDQPAYLLVPSSRATVLEAMQEVCLHRRWILLAAHVRSNHVHAIVDADVKPEKVMNDLKSYASRRLNDSETGENRKRWARHGSTRWLWKDEDVMHAIRYVVEQQGYPMAVFTAPGI